MGVKIIREVPKKLPPIERIEFTTEYGKNCYIKKESDRQFVLIVSGTSYILSKQTVKDVVKGLVEMVEES